MKNDQRDWCTYCCVPRRRSYGLSNIFAQGLKAGTHIPGGEDEEGLGLENATLKWSEVVDAEKQKEQDKTKSGVLGPSGSSDIPSPASSSENV